MVCVCSIRGFAEFLVSPYSRLRLHLNIRIVHKMFCSIQITLKLHANYIHPFSTLQRSGANSLRVVLVIFWMLKNILCILRMFRHKRNRLYYEPLEWFIIIIRWRNEHILHSVNNSETCAIHLNIWWDI